MYRCKISKTEMKLNLCKISKTETKPMYRCKISKIAAENLLEQKRNIRKEFIKVEYSHRRIYQYNEDDF